jgi:hypothetical protein
MSLVVARKTPGTVRVISDIRVTRFGDDVRNGYASGALKAIIISPNLCIAYAGVIRVALSAIRYAASRSEDFEFVANTLSATNEVEFILATRGEICCIKNGQLSRGLENAWIGDKDAFAVFQRNYHAPCEPSRIEEFLESGEAADLRVATRMTTGMRAAIQDSTVHSVGVDDITVVVRPGGFAYKEKSELRASPLPAILPAGFAGGVIPADFGSAKRGAFSYSVMTPRDAGIGAVAFYFYEGKFGLLYVPLLDDCPAHIPSGSPGGFRAEVETRYGIYLQGFDANLTFDDT